MYLRAGYYWATGSMSDKIISSNLKCFGENREKVVGWMQTLLRDVPENEQNFVLMDSTHSLTEQQCNLEVKKDVKT